MAPLGAQSASRALTLGMIQTQMWHADRWDFSRVQLPTTGKYQMEVVLWDKETLDATVTITESKTAPKLAGALGVTTARMWVSTAPTQSPLRQ